MRKKYLIYLFVTLFVILCGNITMNKICNTNYDQLPDVDRKVLEEYNLFCLNKDNIWLDYNLRGRTIVAINKGTFGTAYLLTYKKEVKNIYAKEIKLPKNFEIKVYRIANITPDRLKFLFGNFNTKDVTYQICGEQDIFYVKYSEDSVEKKGNSTHFLPFLAHEAFHYYIQKEWQDAGFRGETYSNLELELLAEEYELFDQINEELKKCNPQKSVLNKYVKQYVEIMKKRLARTDTKKIRAELIEETIEGTAHYVEIQAAKIVNYDYDIMYFSNKKEVPFSEVIPVIQAGKIDQKILSSDIVYNSGALLCKLLNKLEGESWQKEFNNKGKNFYPTLYSIIKKYSENI